MHSEVPRGNCFSPHAYRTGEGERGRGGEGSNEGARTSVILDIKSSLHGASLSLMCPGTVNVDLVFFSN